MNRHVLVLCLDPGIRWDSPKGAAVHLREAVSGLRAGGHRVTLLTRRAAGPVEDDGWRSVPHKFTGKPYFTRKGDRAMKEAGYVAANPHLIATGLRVHQQDPVDAIYERFALWSDVGARLAETMDVPLVLEVNAPLLREQARYRELILAGVAETLESASLMAATRVVVVSRPLEAHLAEKGVPRDRVAVLPNIAEFTRFKEATYRPPAGDEPFVLGFWGSLKPWHGLQAFLPVFAHLAARHPRLRLEIFGSGPEDAALRERSLKLGLEGAILFHGHLPHDEMPQRLQGVHLALAPYPPLEDFYFSPLKIAEAMAAGIPVAASALGDIPNMLKHGGAGFLVAPGDAAAWEQVLEDALTSPETLRDMSALARKVAGDWSWRGQMNTALEGLLPGGTRAAV